MWTLRAGNDARGTSTATGGVYTHLNEPEQRVDIVLVGARVALLRARRRSRSRLGVRGAPALRDRRDRGRLGRARLRSLAVGVRAACIFGWEKRWEVSY